MALSMPRTVCVLSAGAVVLLLSLLWREHDRAKHFETRLAETEMRLAKAAATAARRQPPKPAETPVQSATGVEAVPPTVPSPMAPAAPTVSNTQREFQKALEQQRRWTALAKKAELLAAMNLPPDKSAALKNLLVERDYAERDARDAARKAGLQPHEAAAAEVAKIDAQIQTVLGDNDYARYKEQTSITVLREQLDGSSIPGTLVDAGVPLAADQKTWIAEVMYRAFGPQLVDQPPQSPDPDADRRRFVATLLAEAPGKLTPPQIAALVEYFRKDDEFAALINTLKREASQRK